MFRFDSVGLLGAFLLLCTFFVTGCGKTNAQSAPIQKGENTYYTGYIERGAKFGVKIGELSGKATNILVGQGMRYDGVSHCEAYPRMILNCTSAETWQIYRVREIMKDGNVYIRTESGHVVAIAWSFSIFPPMEF